MWNSGDSTLQWITGNCWVGVLREIVVNFVNIIELLDALNMRFPPNHLQGFVLGVLVNIFVKNYIDSVETKAMKRRAFL